MDLEKKTLRTLILTVAAAAALSSPCAAAPETKAVLGTYADIAEAGYRDSLKAAKTLQAEIGALIENPTDETLKAARDAWIAARVPYMQTEAYRFGNPIVDEWEGKVNAWPLDEGLIDYVADVYGSDKPENEFYTANVIANETLNFAGKEIDASKITPALLSEQLHEAGGVEANVATGYHAVEFLLWGQDLNGTDAGAGNRPATDFDPNNCTGGNCERRVAYLKAATDLLIDDLEWIASQWAEGGAARKAVVDSQGNRGIRAIFVGLGSLSYGEMAGERMKLGLLLHDPEEEHDCFSDNTHNSHYYDVLGIRNVYLGEYTGPDGTVTKGPSVSDLVRARDQQTDANVRAALDETMQAFTALKQRAETTERYDQMLAAGNDEGNAVVQTAIDALIKQAKEFERAIAALGIDGIQFEGSDSLDNPSAVGAN